MHSGAWLCTDKANSNNDFGFSWGSLASGGGIRCYPSIINGWQYGFWSSNSEPPTMINCNTSIPTNWSYWTYSLSGGADANYDVWLHNTNRSGARQEPSGEIMIWTWATGISPYGTNKGTFNIGGTNYTAYQGTRSGGAPLISDQRSNTTSVNLNIRDFATHAKNQGWVNGSHDSTSVQAGFEVANGSSLYGTTSFNVDVAW